MFPVATPDSFGKMKRSTSSAVAGQPSAAPGKGKAPSRPFVFLNVATTADGKIAPANRDYIPFSSPRDQELLLELRATANAVMCGARTVDLYPVNMGPGPKEYRELRLKRGLAEYNLRVIVSGSGTINPKAEIFNHRFSPIIILTTERASKGKLATLRSLGAEVFICGEKELDFEQALRWLREQWGVKRLLCEGGGALNAALLASGLVDEVYQTICTVVFCVRAAPTLADGEGASSLKDAVRLKLKSMRRVGDELFLVHQVAR